jgi:hypothetical protein
MKSKIIKIKKINIIDNYFILLDENNKEYKIEIIKGSINCKIINFNKEQIYINQLSEENIIKIYSIKKIIKKIQILNNNILLSESSSEDFLERNINLIF